ncbi:hypothetical protein [Actinomadura sp. DC4]|uniref:hypothetical protein n=1 Tax=Actinomadura sp. DC4 TaxID=3055069 RepID=UPI0025B22810|nr:hypothetical protein [Actinomadura sp. DC4]MDN3357296.1 hypothetical protein [Actinomadura sp. DC4]
MPVPVRLVLLGAVVAVSTACSSHPAAPPKVASLSTPTRASASPSSGDRLRYRLDMTDADRTALQAPYLKCMSQHGVDVMRTRSGDAPRPSGDTMDKANRACESLLPLPPWEEDARNPHAADFQLKVVACLRKKGVKYVGLSKDTSSGVVGPALGGRQSDQDSIRKGMALIPGCEREVARH